MIFYLPLLLTVIAATAYHVGQKSIPLQIHPMLSLTVSYAVALLGSLIVLSFYPGDFGRASWRSFNWSSIVVGIAIIGIELGFLLAYRAGWRISLASLVGNVLTALLLVAVGVIFFREHLTGRNVVGIALCITGLAMVVQR